MPLKETPVWLEGAEFPILDLARALPDRVDVAVVEARTLGWGASSRNGGMVLTGLKLEAKQLVAKYGLETARRLFAASLKALDCVERIVAEEQIACDFARSGHLLLACKPAHFRALAREAELLERDFGHPTRVIQPNRL